MTRYRWVAARKAEGFPITMAAKVAGVSRQAFYDWRVRTAAGPTAAELAEVELVELMALRISAGCDRGEQAPVGSAGVEQGADPVVPE